MNATELDDGRVFVQVTSRRGTGTRDEDEVVVRAVFDDVERAEEESHRLNELLEARMEQARSVGGTSEETGSDAGDDASVTDAGSVTATGDRTDADTVTDASGEAGRTAETAADQADADETDSDWDPTEYDGAFSKVYLGEGSDLGGWIPVPRWVVAEEILPLVRRNTVRDEDAPSVKVNFSSDVPVDGWTDVEPYAAVEDIEPLVREHRLDR